MVHPCFLRIVSYQIVYFRRFLKQRNGEPRGNYVYLKPPCRRIILAISGFAIKKKSLINFSLFNTAADVIEALPINVSHQRCCWHLYLDNSLLSRSGLCAARSLIPHLVPLLTQCQEHPPSFVITKEQGLGHVCRPP